MAAPRRLTLVAASWEPDAACLRWPDPDDFFPDRGDENPAVLRVCHGCTVMRQCAARRRCATESGTASGVA